MKNRHLLKLLDLSREEIYEILDLADQLKYNQKHGIPHEILKGKTLAMIFSKSSTRTRVSFEVGMFQLGGHALFLSDAASQMGRGELIQDRYGSVPVINGLTAFSHPCQVLADLMTIREHKAQLEGLKLCYVGDGNNVANSLIVGGLTCGMDVSVASPGGYRPDQRVLDFAAAAGGAFTLTDDPMAAARDADVIVTDSWAPMGREGERPQRAQALAGYQVNDALLSAAKSDCMVQHCLPAYRGQEITEAVFEAHAGEIFDEAENRLHAQKAVMALLMR